MSEKYLRELYVFVLLFSVFSSVFSVGFASAAPATRVAGVKAGDKFKYGGFLALWVSDVPDVSAPQNFVDANNTLFVEDTVLSVSGSLVSFESRTVYRNGTVQVKEGNVDVNSGSGAGNLTFVAAGLGVNDRVYASGDFYESRINSTDLHDSGGLMREVNLLNVTNVYAESKMAVWVKYFWDKATGLLVENFWSYAELTEGTLVTEGSIEYKMVDNNVWVGVSDSIVPVAKAGSNQTAETGVSVVFDAGESRDNVGIAKFLWDFGDGSSAEGLSVSHVFSKAGVFNVTLTVEDGAGNKSFDFVSVTVEAASGSVQLPLPLIGFVVLVVLSVAVWSFFRRERKRERRRERR